MLWTALWMCGVSVSALDALAPTPWDVSGFKRGAAAVESDPASMALSRGYEAHLRYVSQSNTHGSFAGFVSVPIGRWTLGGGYAYRGMSEGPLHGGYLNLGWNIHPRLSVGVGYRVLSAKGRSAGVWNAGALYQPWSWWAFSMGVDHMNQPVLSPSLRTVRSLRIGTAIRPLWGKPLLTLAADAHVEGDAWDWTSKRMRALIDVSPSEGWHVLSAWSRSSQGYDVWLGLSLALGSTEARVGAVCASKTHGWDPFSSSTAEVTWASKPSETVWKKTRRTVQMSLRQMRASGKEGFFHRPFAVPTETLVFAEIAQDPTVEKVVVNLDVEALLLSESDALARMFVRLREAGKQVVARLETAKEPMFLLACMADRIEIDPMGYLDIDGYSLTRYYVGDALKKWGIGADAVAVGTHKSAPEMFTRASPSEASNESVHAVLGDAYEQLWRVLRERRGFSAARIEHTLKQGLWSAQEAVRIGLVDGFTHGASLQDVWQVPAREGAWEQNSSSPLWGQKPVIHTVAVTGTLMDTCEGLFVWGPCTQANDVVQSLEAARTNHDVVGVVLRIDSPGGSVSASEKIWRAAKALAQTKPLVVSMGSVAASGGYYIAAPAHRIFAEPSTVTGSIGVFSLRFHVGKALEHWEIYPFTTTYGPHADWETPVHVFTEEDKARMHKHLKGYYDAFLQRVAEGRSLSLERLESLAEGRIWTGRQALEVGLIDAYGGLLEALEETARRAGYADMSQVSVVLPKKPCSVQLLARKLSSSETSHMSSAVSSVHNLFHSAESSVMAMTLLQYEVQP